MSNKVIKHLYWLTTVFIVLLSSILLSSRAYAQSGCCSWHGGESYCDYSTYRWVCADGTYSPTCACGGYVPPPSCPYMSTYNTLTRQCECLSGYVYSPTENMCITKNQECVNKYGISASYDYLSDSCECQYGYHFEGSRCVLNTTSYILPPQSYQAEAPSVQLSPPQFPSDIKARWYFTPRSDKTFDVTFTWDDPNPTSYSLSIGKVEWADPGPLADTKSTTWTFNNIAPGNWYVNMKKDINGVWSQVTAWTLESPAWTSPPPSYTPVQPSEFPSPSTAVSGNKVVNNLGLILFFGAFALVSYFVTKKI